MNSADFSGQAAFGRSDEDDDQALDQEVSDLGQAIAVIGVAGRFPGADTLEQFWNNVVRGRECVSRFSEEELANAGIPEAVRRIPSYVPARAIISDPYLFDAPFFGFSATEAILTDPQHRLFLECAWEALENAGYDPFRYQDLIGVYAGADVNSYAMGNLLLWTHDLQSLIGNDKDYLATRLSFKLNLRGPSVTVQTACSTSLVAVQLACQGLIGYQCDMALAGGVGIAFPQTMGYVYQPGSILSPDGHCRPFDARAQGTVGGDGVGLVVLKRLADALADGDAIRAVIRGAAINNDGAMKIGFTAPSVTGQAEVIAMAQAMAGISPASITYIEAHGTGTELGDPVEIAALTEVFRDGTDQRGFCAIGSLKANVGHMNSAAGIGGLIKTILALEHKTLPPSINFETPSPAVDWQSSPFYVNTQARPWETNGHPRRAGVSSFGVGGTNAHVVLEEAPELAATSASRPYALLWLSARSEAALTTATANLLGYLESHPGDDLADIAYTLLVGRRRFAYSRLVVAASMDEAAAGLSRPMPALHHEPRTPQVVFLFPGQGSQYAQMARGLYEREPAFREHFDACAEVMAPALGKDLRQAVFAAHLPAPGGATSQGQDAAINETALAQPALFAVEYALARWLMSMGVRPRAMLGHSVGEYVAACLSGVMRMEDAARLLVIRGRLIQALPRGAMLAVSASAAEVAELCGNGAAVAAINAPGMTVVAGSHEAIAGVEARCREQSVACTRLRTSHAFHSPMMEPALAEYRQAVASVRLSLPAIPFLSNVTGTWITAADAQSPDYWVRQVREPVRFSANIRELLSDPDRIFVEVGPGSALTALLRRQGPDAHGRVAITTMRYPRAAGHEHGRPSETGHSRGSRDDQAVLLEALGQLHAAYVEVDWRAFYADERRRRVPLPTYPFERQRYARDLAAAFGLTAPAQPTHAAHKRADVATWLQVPSWTRALPLGALTEGGGRLSEATGEDGNDAAALAALRPRWLVFADGSAVVEAMVAGIRADERDGCGCVVVAVGPPGSGLKQHAAGRYSLDPGSHGDAGVRERYEALMAELAAEGGLPTKIIHTWSLGRDVHSRSFEDEQYRGFYSVMFLCQALASTRPQAEQAADSAHDQGIDIAVVTEALANVLGSDPVQPEKAGLLSICQVAEQELRDVHCRVIDIPVSKNDAAIAAAILAEVCAGLGGVQEPRVAYRGGYRWVAGYEALPAAGLGPSRLRKGGTYLIVGGLGKLGLRTAAYLARAARAKLVLVSRTGLVARSEWDGWLRAHSERNPISQKIRAIRDLEELGSEVLIANADVADEAQMAAVIERAVARFGRLDGAIHAAGTVGAEVFRAIADTEPHHCQVHFHAKARGLLVLDRVLPDTARLRVLFSSLSTALGGVGFSAYAAGNHVLDAFAARGWLSVGWDAWAIENQGGAPAVAAPLATMADMAIQGEEGEAALDLVFRVRGVSHVLVATADIRARLALDRAHAGAGGPRRAAGEMGKLSAGVREKHARPALETPYVAPQGELEEALVSIWEELLGIAPIGVQDNFFQLGGDSLMAIQLSTRLRDSLGVSIAVNELFEQPTIASLAERVNQVRAATARRQSEEIEAKLAMIENMSEEEVRTMLAELGG